jgi:hypothetical protein
MSAPISPPGRREGLLRLAYWLIPPVFCLAVYFWGLRAWYQQDDFVWLGQRFRTENLHDFLQAIFAPSVHGTFRPLSERLFLLVVGRAFGTDAFPAHLWVFLTQVANLALISSLARRMSNSRIASFAAPILWTANGALAFPMAWSSAYMHILCATCILLALHFLLRYIETGKRSDYWLQWAVLIFGFGVMESMIVYPAIAAAYTLLRARKQFLSTLPMFAASILFWVFHSLYVPKQQAGTYSVHFDSSLPHTFVTYWKWALVPWNWTEWLGWRPRFVLEAKVAMVVLTVAILGYVAYAALRRNLAPSFGLICFYLLLLPVLPLKEHVSYYYLALPVMGLSLVGAFGLAAAARAGWWARLLAAALLFLFLNVQVSYAAWSCKWWYRRSQRIESVVVGAAAVRQAMPAKTLVLTGIDQPVFDGTFVDGAFAAFGVSGVYVDPGQRAELTAHAVAAGVDLSSVFPDPADFQRGLLQHTIEVLATVGPVLIDVTPRFEIQAQASSPLWPRRVDVAGAASADCLRGEWREPEGDHRWMGKQAGVILAGPAAPGEQLHLAGHCPGQQVAAGPVGAKVLVDGAQVGELRLTRGDADFEAAFPLPPQVVGKASIEVTIRLDRTFHAVGDVRELGLSFGTFEVR